MAHSVLHNIVMHNGVLQLQPPLPEDMEVDVFVEPDSVHFFNM